MRRLLVIAIGLAMVVSSAGCGLLDTVNRLPGTVAGGRGSAASDYSRPEQMPAALALLRTALQGDDQVFRLTMGNDGASVHTLTQAYRLVDGAVSPDSSVGIRPTAPSGLPLSEFDPAAAMTRLSQGARQRGCTEPSRIALTVYSNQSIIADLTCMLDGAQVQLVEGPEGDLLGEIDLTSRTGLTKAFSDALGVQPPGQRYTVFSVQYDNASGIPALQTIAGRTQTMRLSRVSDLMPVLFQADTGVDSAARELDITGITATTFATVYDGAKQKCGDVSLINLVSASDGSVRFLSGTFSCPYLADRTGRPI